MTPLRKAAWVLIVVCVAVVCIDVSAQTALPDFQTLYKAVRGNLERAERETFRYTFKERRTDVHANPFGRIGTGGTRVLEVYPSATPRLTYRRLIERNGMPVSQEELAEQDRQYRLRVDEVRKTAAAENLDERRARAENIERARQRGERRIADIVDALQFKMEGRVVLNGTPALLISFTPKPGAKPSTREGKIAQKFAGKIWIEEALSEVMLVEAESIEDVVYGYGVVARVNEGTKATLIRRPVEGGIWMPTRLTMNGRGRAALFRRFAIDLVNEWFDYRRLSGESATPFLDTR
jgi:hypothetical protein